MNKTLKIILIIAVGLAFLGSVGFLGYALLFGEKVNKNDNANVNGQANTNAKPVNNNTNTSISNGNTNTVVIDNTNSAGNPSETTEEAVRQALESTSTIFAERYGSFSNENDFENITSLYGYMTNAMKNREEAEISKASSADQGEFYGVSTSVVTLDVEEIDVNKGTAKVSAYCQRSEEKGDQPPVQRVFHQTLTFNYKVQDSDWLVDSVGWGEER